MVCHLCTRSEEAKVNHFDESVEKIDKISHQTLNESY